MPGQTWFASAISFLFMWLAMMMPSALPMFLKTRRQRASLCYMASGYFAIWLAAGVEIYASEWRLRCARSCLVVPFPCFRVHR